jgi:peptide/nickel transport system substrate-binding protein
MSKKRLSVRLRVMATAGLLIALAALAFAGSAVAAKRGGTLTIGMMLPNGSLNPAAGNPGTDPVYLDPIYAPLIRQGTNGKLQGVLATNWGFVGKHNKVFTITLRKGVKFSNGQPLNSAAVVGSLKAYRAGTGNGATWMKACGTIKTSGPLGVTIHCSAPSPDLPYVMSDLLLGGDIVAPASLKNPSSLASDPIGAGEYVVDTSQTLIGSKYVYDANPKYFDQAAIHWQHIIVETISTPTTGVEAVESGQIQQYFTVSATALQTAQSAGLPLSVLPSNFQGVELADRSGSGGSPLENFKVREALEYAVDRPAIANALWGSFGVASDEAGAPGVSSTWDKSVSTYWYYNVTKAKQLMAQAGYPNGFTLDVEAQSNRSSLMQAVASYWQAIGVQTKITVDPTPTAAESNILSKNYPAFAYGYGVLPMGLMALNWFVPNANQYNPFATNDPKVKTLLATAQNATGGKQTKGYQAVEDYGVENAWWVGIGYLKVGYVDSKSISVPGARYGYQGNADDVTP